MSTTLLLAHSAGVRASLRRPCPLQTRLAAEAFCRRHGYPRTQWEDVARAAREGFGDDATTYPLTLAALSASLEAQDEPNQ